MANRVFLMLSFPRVIFVVFQKEPLCSRRNLCANSAHALAPVAAADSHLLPRGPAYLRNNFEWSKEN
jgi:hypothetical protein